MTSFELPRTAMTPQIRFNPGENAFEFVGDCYPENPRTFFAPFFDALESHLARAQPQRFTGHFHLRYVNSASTVALRRLVQLLDGLAEAGGDVRVEWVHDPEDDVNEELGRDLSMECSHAQVLLRPQPQS